MPKKPQNRPAVSEPDTLPLSLPGAAPVGNDSSNLETARRQLETRERQQAAVATLGRSALAATGLQFLLDEAVRVVADTLDVPLAKVLELQPGGERLLLRAGVGWKPGLVGNETVGTGRESQAGYTLFSKEPVVVEDLPRETRFRGPRLLLDHGVVSGLSVVIGPRDDPLGVLGAHSVSPRAFTVDDVHFFLAVAHVLSEAIRRRQVEAALRENEERLRLAKNAAELGIYDWNLRSGEIRWDDRIREIWGVGPHETIRYDRFMAGLQAEDWEATQAAVDRALDPAGDGYYYAEYRVINARDGEMRWISASGDVTFQDGEPVRMVGTVQDITERVRITRELEDWANRLEERVAERTAVAERRTRELRKLAAELTQADQRARKRVAQTIHDDLQQLLVAAKMRLPKAGLVATREQIQRIDEMLTAALATSRSLVSDLSPPVLHEGSLEAVCEWLARHMKDQHGLRVDLDCREDPEGMDETVLTVILESLRELLFNVVKHAETDRASLSVRRESGDLVVRLSDSGRGFDPGAVQEKPSGFGMLNVHERLEALGGSMTIDAAPGRGARVTLRLPFRGGETQAASAAPPAVPRRFGAGGDSGGVVRILVVDDHEIVREGLVTVLSQAPGLQVVGEAGDGYEAIDKATELQPDVVVMDVSMPRLNGIEATHEIVRRLPSTRVIGLSLHEAADVAAALRGAGAIAYLQKDTASTRLIEEIRRHCGPDPAAP